MIQQVNEKTVVELHELCLDICPFPTGDRDGTCPGCPLYKHALEKQWRFALPDALQLVKDWATFVGKKIR
jgi:hypothetical protein